MSKAIKAGDRVITHSGSGVVLARYKEPLGHYYLYQVELFDSGKVIVTKTVYAD